MRRCSVKKVLPRPATLLKKETLAQVLSCEFYEISKNTFQFRYLRWLFLNIFHLVIIILSQTKPYLSHAETVDRRRSSKYAGVLKNLVNLTEKQLRWSIFL